MDFTLIQSLWSIVILITFLGIVLWAYSGKRKTAFDEAARLPFDDEVLGQRRQILRRQKIPNGVDRWPILIAISGIGIFPF